MSGLRQKYFVLKPRGEISDDAYARASRRAMNAYADSIEGENPGLANDLRVWVSDEDSISFESGIVYGVTSPTATEPEKPVMPPNATVSKGSRNPKTRPTKSA